MKVSNPLVASAASPPLPRALPQFVRAVGIRARSVCRLLRAA
jgi:hypothetical protein